MITSPSSGLSAEAKEFVPFVQTPTTSIPLYVDENSVASIYPSDQPPFMIQSIYPMMISNSKMTGIPSNNLLPYPEIEFHIQPYQQQEFHIDSCSTIPQVASSAASLTNNTSQIVLLPTTTTAATAAVTPTGYYPGPQMIYSSNEQSPAFYSMDYCEQPLINFSLQQPTHITKSNIISSQQQQQQHPARPTSFRQQHGNAPSSYRPGNRGSGGISNPNRNSYYDYHSRRNGSSYPSHTGRGNTSNNKRISSSYQQHDSNNYYHHPSSRSRGYSSRSSHYHDEQRQDHSDYYNHEKEFYENEYQQSNEMNDDGTPFEFRPEDFPSLPINPPSDKTSSQSMAPNTTSSTSSWNAIVSTPRPHSTSPHSVPPSSLQSQDQRSDRSRSFNMKLSSTNEHKSSSKTNNNNKPSRSTLITKSKSPHRASKIAAEEQQSSPTNNPIEIDGKDDGFIQTKQQQRRLKRKNKMKEEPLTSGELPTCHVRDDGHLSPPLERQISLSTMDQRSDNHSTVKNDKSSGLIPRMNQMDLADILNTLDTPPEVEQHNSDTKLSAISTNARVNSLEPKRDKERHATKSKFSINQALETNQSNGTDIINTNEDDQNWTRLSSSTNNSSDTSDYDDAVDNLANE